MWIISKLFRATKQIDNGRKEIFNNKEGNKYDDYKFPISESEAFDIAEENLKDDFCRNTREDITYVRFSKKDKKI